jgi:microcystin-dependent protein
MSDQFLAEIRSFPFNYAPYQWAMCSGQIMAVQQNTALFSLVGTNFGGNGTSNFGLPNLGGNVAVCAGQGNGLSLYDVGQSGGSASITLTDKQNASHNHLVQTNNTAGTSNNPNNLLYGKGELLNAGDTKPINTFSKVGNTPPSIQLNPNAIGQTGGNQPHNNMMPYLTINFCIALTGIFPQRS